MSSRTFKRFVSASWYEALASSAILLLGAVVVAQDSWPTYHGDYSGRHHTALAAITPDNVHQLTLAWAFQTNQTQQIKSTPIVVNGTMYISAPDNVWAIDVRTARQLWRYTYPANDAFHIGHRGVAVYKDLVYLTTPDAHLVALDARDGKVKWNVVIADYKRGYWSTNAPLLIRNHLIVGVSGDFDNLPGVLKSFDPETGKLQWTFYSTPPAGEAEPASGGATGGQMWMTGTYDPDLNLMYVGTGNPTPVLNGEARPGDNPWTCSIVALNPDTGRLAWGFQASPHDTHDWDAAEVPVLVDATLDGTPRKLLLQASRNGYFFVLDRTNGRSVLTTTFAAANWANDIDPRGRPIPNPDKEPKRDGRLVAPNEGGATNYRSPSFDAGSGLFVVSAVDAYGIYFFKKEHGAYGWAGANSGVWSRAALRAIDYRTGKIRWSHDLGDGAASAGVLTTSTGVTFSGDANGNLLALRTSDGTTLWHATIGRVGNSPISYELDGRQYLVVGGGSAIYAFALPVGADLGRPAGGASSAPTSAQNDPNQKDWIQLFNGRDLADWAIKFTHHDLGENFNDTFRAEDGLLKVRYDKWTAFDREFGHIFYKQPFSYYLLAAEYRFVGEQLPSAGPSLAWAKRNNGLMLHAPDPKTMLKDQDFPISIEVQLLGGLSDGKPRTTANLCTPGTHVVLNGKLHTPHCTNSTSKTYDGDQWVRVEVLVHGDELVRHIIEGQTVLEYSKPQIGGGSASPTDPAIKVDGTPLTGGFISLQAETAPIDFRKVELLNLEGCADPKARNYKAYIVKQNSSMCRF